MTRRRRNAVGMMRKLLLSRPQGQSLSLLSMDCVTPNSALSQCGPRRIMGESAYRNSAQRRERSISYESLDRSSEIGATSAASIAASLPAAPMAMQSPRSTAKWLERALNPPARARHVSADLRPRDRQALRWCSARCDRGGEGAAHRPAGNPGFQLQRQAALADGLTQPPGPPRATRQWRPRREKGARLQPTLVERAHAEKRRN